MRFTTAATWLLVWNFTLCPSVLAACKKNKKKCKSSAQCCEGLVCFKKKCNSYGAYELFRSFEGDSTGITASLGKGILMCDKGETIAFPNYLEDSLPYTRTFVQTLDYSKPSTSVVMGRRNDVLTNPKGNWAYYASQDFWAGAISGDGQVLAIANYNKNEYDGEVKMYQWSVYWEEIQTISGMKGTGEHFGSSLALSNDGSVMVICASAANDNTGYFQRFTKERGVWKTEGDEMDGSVDDELGSNVAMSADGKRVAVNIQARKVQVFDWYDNDGWRLYDTINNLSNQNGSNFGYSGLQISHDGTDLLIGDKDRSDGDESVLVFKEIEGKFQKKFHKKRNVKIPKAAAYVPNAYAMSGDGGTIAFPTGYDDDSTIEVFKRSGERYKMYQVIRDKIRPDTVALNQDGNVLSFESNPDGRNGAIQVYVVNK